MSRAKEQHQQERSSSTGSSSRDESPRSKNARNGAIRALDAVDDLLPMVEEMFQTGSAEQASKGKGKGKEKAQVVEKSPRAKMDDKATKSSGKQVSKSVTSHRAGSSSTGAGSTTNTSSKNPPGRIDLARRARNRERRDESPTPVRSKQPRGPGTSAVTSSPGLKAPYDLPTEYYAAIIRQTDFELYLDYPVRIHHLKYPHSSPQGSKAAQAGTDWEAIHLHQRVSSPRVYTRWARHITPADRARMESHFFRFADNPSTTTRSNTSETGTSNSLGYRPHRDTLLLDEAYLKAHKAHLAAHRHALDPASSLIPIIGDAKSRAKVTCLAVSAAAFASATPTSTSYSPKTADAATSRDAIETLCTTLATAFPNLVQLILFAPAVADRPAGVASWALETEFARWASLTEVLRLEAEGAASSSAQGPLPAASFAMAAGLLDDSSSSNGTYSAPLVRAVEEAWARARDAVAAAESSSDSASQGSSTEAVVGMACIVQPLVLVYFRDAFERAVANGWEHERLVPIDHIDLELE